MLKIYVLRNAHVSTLSLIDTTRKLVVSEQNVFPKTIVSRDHVGDSTRCTGNGMFRAW